MVKIRDVNPILETREDLARPLAEGLGYMSVFHQNVLGKPLGPGFLQDFISNVKDAAERGRGRTVGPAVPVLPLPQGGPVALSGNIFSKWGEEISDWFSGAAEDAREEWKRWEDSGKLRVVGGWAARIGAVVTTAIATYYTGGATTPLLVSSLNVLMTDPATSTWEEDISAFVMAGEIIPPEERPAELEQYEEITTQVNANLWDLPAAKRDEILAKGESYLLKMAADAGPKAVEEMRAAIEEYKRRGLSGEFSVAAREMVAVSEPSFLEKHRSAIGFALVAGMVVVGGTVLWITLAE